MTDTLKGHVVDIHAYYDTSRIDMPALERLRQKNGLETIILSAACTHEHEPDKSQLMYDVQRFLLRHRALRWIAHLMSLSFYGSTGKLRLFWRLFTRKNKVLAKVMNPDNEGLRRLISVYDPKHFQMWHWVNPQLPRSADALSTQLNDPFVAGIKLHGYWHDFDLNQVQDIVEACRKSAKPLYLILGFGAAGHYPRFLKQLPSDLSIIFGYGGFPYFQDLWKAILPYPNCYTDLTSNHLDRSLVQEAIQTLGSQRCLFGTDCPYNFYEPSGEFSYAKTFERVVDASLSKLDLENIFFKNFRQLSSRVAKSPA